MIQVTVEEARSRLAGLLERVKQGDEVIIARRGHPIARLVPYGDRRRPRVPGLDAGLVHIAEDFDAPLPSGILEAFDLTCYMKTLFWRAGRLVWRCPQMDWSKE